MDNQLRSNTSGIASTSQDSLEPIVDSNFVSQYSATNQMYATESLDVREEGAANMVSAPPPSHRRFSLSKRKSLLISLTITGVVLLATGLSMALLIRNSPKDKTASSELAAQQDVKLQDATSTDIPPEIQGANQSLLVNGDIATRGSLKISNAGAITIIRAANTQGTQTLTLPATSGVLCLDSNNCNYAPTDSVAALQGVIDNLQAKVNAFGPVATLSAGVSTLNGQKGAVTIQGSVNQIAVTTNGGVVTLSTPQNLDANANVQFNSLTVSSTGQITANRLVQTAAGNNVSIDAGADSVILISGSRSFQLPNSGAASQTICTQETGCALGSGNAVLLGQASAQTDSNANPSIFINDTAGGALIRMQSGGVDRLTVANNGDTTIGNSGTGSLTVSGLGSGVVKSTAGLLSISAVNLATEVSGLLPVANGGTGANDAVGARSNLGAAASGANSDITSTTALNTITPSSGLTIGADTQILTLQGSGSSTFAAGSGANITTVGFAAPSGSNTITFPDLSGTVCLSSGNCTMGGAAGGDLTGSYPNPTIAKLQGTDLNIGGPTAGQVLVYNGTNTEWRNVSVSGDVTITETGVISIATGAVTSAKIADGTITGTDIAGSTITGGNIANGTVANGNLVNSGLTVTAGAGLLTGGAVSLGGNVTLDIGAGDGITVNANDVAVDGTVCRTTGNCAGIGGVGDVLQGGNSFGSTMTIGTNDVQSLQLETSGIARLTINSTGQALFSSNLDTNGSLTVGNADQFFIDTLGVVTAGTWHGSTIGIAYGGTGLTATPSNGQLLIGNGTGYSLGVLSNSDGTVDIINGAGSIEISVPRADQCSTCADHTLSNLADIVAINKSLLPASAGAINLGGSSVPYGLLFLSGSSSNPASNNFTIGGTATTSRTINLPDTDGTVCLRETCIQLSPGSPQSGGINVTGTVNAGSLILGGAATVNSLASAGGNALTLGATGAGQTTNVQGNGISFTNGSATYTFNSNTGTHTLCDDSGNCAGSGGGVIASGGSAYNLPVFTSANTVINSIFSQNAGATAGTVAGTLQINGATLSGAAALTVSSTGGGNALNLSSGSGTLGLTGSTATIQRVGNSLTFDINSGASSTLTIANSNGSNVANLSVEGGITIGSGQTYKINNVDINTAGTLNNVAYLNQANAFSNVGNTTFAGTINGQTIGSSASFTGTLAVRGANALTLGQASGNTGAIVFQNSSGSNTVTLKASDTNPGSSVVFTLPSATGSAGYCLSDTDGNGTLGFVNCSSGLSISGSPTDNRLLKFTSSGTAVTNSSIDDDGSVVTIQGSSNSLAIAGGTVAGLGNNSISLGTASSTTGGINFYNEDTGNSVVLQSGATANNYNLILPTDQGTGCLRNDGSGQLTYFACVSSGGGGGGSGVTANSATTGRLGRWINVDIGTGTFVLDDSSIRDNGSRVGVGVAVDSTAVLTVGSAAAFKVTNAGALTVAGITNSTTAFDNGSTGITNTGSLAGVSTLTATGLLQTNANGQALSLGGAPTNSATQSLLSLGGAIASGNNVANGGTYIGINAPASGAGSAADFINFQANGTSKLKVDKDGNVTSGTINGVTLGGSGALSSGGYTLTLTGNSTLNQNLTTSSAVQFSGLTLTNALSPANGGTGSDTSGAQAGAALIFNATTGKFQANRITSSDNSILVGNTDGNIDLVVNSCTTCAKTDLSNLAATTNINSTLRAQTGVDIGAAANPFREAYIYGTSASPSSNNFKLTGTATALRTITLPDTSGTACLTTTCVTLQGGGHTPQSGYIDISNDLKVGGGFSLGGTATVNTLVPAASTALVLGATGSGQTSRLQGTSVSFVSGGITYNFSHSGSGTHTICDDTGNCAGAGGGVTASGGSAFYLPVFTSANTVINSLISQDAGAGATTATVNGKLVVSAANTTGTSLTINNSSLNGNNSNLANFNFTNANTSASATTVNGIAVTPTGTINGNSNANTLNGIRLNNVAPITNNSFYALNVGTGYDDILRYNNTSVINGSGAVQNLNGQAASYYLNATNINAGTLAVARGGTGVGTFTANGVLYGNGTGAIQATGTGTTGQCLIATTGGAPSWSSCAGTGSGVTLQAAYDNSGTPANIDLADGKNFTVTAKNQATSDPSILFSLECNATCSSATAGRFAVQATSQSGHDVFAVKPNGDIVVGDETTANYIKFQASNGYKFAATGNARNVKSIILNAEYPSTVLDAGGCANTNGTMISGYTGSGYNSKPENYFQWTTTQTGTAQCYEVVVQVPIPSDFDGFTGTQSIDTWSDNITNGTVIMDKNVDGTNDGGSYTTTLTPSSASAWQNKTFTFSGSYNAAHADKVLTLRFRTSSVSNAKVQIGKITLQYYSKF